MTNKLRMPKKEVPKKTAVSKLAKDKEVRIVKHFLPVTYSRESYNYELPEVDNGEDDEEYSRTCFKKYSDLNRLVFPEKKSKYTRNVFSKTENNAKTSVLARKKNKRGILSRTEPSYRSKSCIECSRNLVLEEPDSVFIKKPSNNSLRREKPKETSSKINNQNILVSSSSPNFNDGYITNLKREIAQNRGKGSDVCLDTKLYLMHKNEIHNEKVRLLREEISKLVNMDLSERKNRVSEIKTEINQFRRNDYFAVYNVETQLGDTDGDSDKEREDDESDKSSTTCIKKPVKPNMNDSTESEFSPTPSQSEFDEDREKEVKSSDLSEVEQETRKPAEPACLHICLMGDEKNPGLLREIRIKISRMVWVALRCSPQVLSIRGHVYFFTVLRKRKRLRAPVRALYPFLLCVHSDLHNAIIFRGKNCTPREYTPGLVSFWLASEGERPLTEYLEA